MLTVAGLRKVFGPITRGGNATVALDDVDLVVPTGTFAAVLGPSGSGKTTLLRCVAGFERPDAGVVALRGRELFSPNTFVRANARGIGIVPQEGALFPHLTVAQNVGFGLAGWARKARQDRVGEILDLVGLSGLAQRRPDQLSGGQQQRVALARALAPEPELILLDEPFSALDAKLRNDLRTEVRELLRGVGATALLVTHDQAEALSLSDYLVVMRDGRVVADGDPRSVYSHPADIELARFLGDAVVLAGVVADVGENATVECALGTLAIGHWLGGRGACQVLVRPEQIGVHPVGSLSAATVTGTVLSTAYFGHDVLLRLGVAGVPQPVPVRLSGEQPYRVAELVALEVTSPVSVYPLGTVGSSSG